MKEESVTRREFNQNCTMERTEKKITVSVTCGTTSKGQIQMEFQKEMKN